MAPWSHSTWWSQGSFCLVFIVVHGTHSRMRYWLMKSEPDVFSIDDLKAKKRSFWDGVRNYQARNFMMNDMTVGDMVLFYHSNAEPPGIAGLARVCETAKPDPSSWDKKSEYFDPKSTAQNPRWHAVTVEFVKKFDRIYTLDDIRKNKALQTMLVIKKGQRLSIQPVTKAEYDVVVQLQN